MKRNIKTVTLSALILAIIFSSLTTLAQQGPGRDFDDPGEQEDLNRELWEFARKTPYADVLSYVAEAQRQSRARQTNEIELPNGWRIAPAGTQVEVARLPYEAVPFAGKLVVLGTGYYYQEPQEVSIVDVRAASVVKTIRVNSLFPSALVGPDGDLYISGGYDQKVYRVDRQFNVVREYEVNGFAGGLAFFDRRSLAVGYMATRDEEGNYIRGKLAILDTQTGKIEQEAAVGYFPYSLRYLSGKLYVTLVGENRLAVYSRRLKLLKSFPVEPGPLEMCSDRNRLYVVNASADRLTIFDTSRDRVTGIIDVAEQGSRFGVAPTSCAVKGERLFVTLAGTNSVAVLDKRTRRLLARVPTAWYPTKVLVDKNKILVLSARGIRARRPNPEGPRPLVGSRIGDYVLELFNGTLSIIREAELGRKTAAWTRQVESGSPIYSPKEGFKLPIRYIFYVIKENRTYDQVLGDLGRGKGDPSLTLFGEEITPIHHQLAREFVTLDNFFVNGEMSILGHSFTTAGYASPFLQWLGFTSYSYRWKGNRYGTSPVAAAPAYLWDMLEQKGVDYRIYGEAYFPFTRSYKIITEVFGADSPVARKYYDTSLVATGRGDRGAELYEALKPFYGRADTPEDAYKLLGNPEFATRLSTVLVGDQSLARALEENLTLRRRFAQCLYHYPFNFPSWDLSRSDLERVQAWKVDFQKQLEQGRVAQLQYIWLPNDHTDGANERILNAFQFMAQNDAALGRLVETISASPIWRESLILVVEDDAQNGADHVDATRTVALAAGPYVRRDAVVSDRYDQLSMLRTIGILLGLNPINLGDRMAVPMFGIFSDEPNFEPFVAVTPSARLAAADRERFEQLASP